jgi:hypothetical protein
MSESEIEVVNSKAQESSKPEAGGNALLGIGVALAGWAVPGLGHLILRKWSKALAYFICVAGLAWIGLIMRGGIFVPGSTDILDRLGFFADLGTGGIYYLAQSIQTGGPDLAHASGDYGTRLFAAAGILNMLTVLEGFDLGYRRSK